MKWNFAIGTKSEEKLGIWLNLPLEFIIPSSQILINFFFILTSNIPLNIEVPAPWRKLHSLNFLGIFNVLNR